MSITLAIALALIIVSIVVTAITNGWLNPLVYIGWAFAVVLILGPLIGR